MTKLQISKSMKTLLPPLQRLLKRLVNTDTYDNVFTPFSQYTLEVTAGFSMGLELDCDGKDAAWSANLIDFFEFINSRLANPLAYYLSFFVPSFYKQKKAVLTHLEGIKGIVERVEKSVIADYESGKPFRMTFAHAVLDPNEEDRFTPQEFFGNVMTLLLAGVDTTANTLTWAMYYFAKYPEWKARIAAEFQEHIGEIGEDIDIHQLDKMVVTKAFIDETVRTNGAAPVNGVCVTKETELEGVQLHPGDNIFLLTRQMGLRIYPHPEWNPERFLDPQEADKLKEVATVGFGIGPRICPGRNLAIIMAQLALGVVASHFEVEYLRDGPPQEINKFVTSADRVPIRFTKISSCK